MHQRCLHNIAFTSVLSVTPCDIASNSKHKWQNSSLQNPKDPYKTPLAHQKPIGYVLTITLFPNKRFRVNGEQRGANLALPHAHLSNQSTMRGPQ